MTKRNRYGSEVMDLAEDSDMSPQEIADKLGCSLQTVYSNWPPWVLTPASKKARYDRGLFEKTVWEMYEAGAKMKGIAEKLGVPYSRVQRCVSRRKTWEQK